MSWIEESRLKLNEKLKESRYQNLSTDMTIMTIMTTKMVQGSGGDDLENDRGIGVVEEVAKPKLAKPPMYRVVLMNDDYTPMEFVIEVLQMFFSMNREKATQVMLAVHTVGKATCGIYTRDVAETKSIQVNQYAQDSQHPLVSEIEATD